MPCTCVGLLSLVMSVVAVVFSTTAAGLPLWSMLGVSPKREIAAASFTAGVWGYCTELSYANTGTTTASLQTTGPLSGTHGQCYLYYTSNTKVRVNLNNDLNNTIVLPNQGICATFSQDNSSSAPRLFSTVEGIDQAVFDDFLTKTCGVKGKVTLAFSMMSPVFGIMGTLMIALGVCCSKNRSCLVSFALFMTLLAGVWSLIVCIVWSQQQPSGNGLNFALSYYLEIAALVSYAIAVFFVGVHMTQGTSHGKAKSSQGGTAKLQEALEKHKKVAASGKQPTRLV
ncbi:hypothetical protein DYB28_000598 [Aphanomyces astaci]|uniref:Claudin n=2 Tax=Aphanomyces astaci TaxID=112090 RepID=A0A397ANI7_APHAT|nr:hypothetical protein AaE_014111 [Aphanomyces astaci]RHY07815.1 hypothetical protein DYB36_002532 [Aphanomyces astaci]RHY58930.1 hypothetical protein DYB34_000880 [Aphanomyces astaci]RHY71267.1 hypothetical protein DYB30_001713 [Aphanomyces astaci]RHY87238.1 hypothetical protein DYB31_000437 [Aphanomyces astaci]